MSILVEPDGRGPTPLRLLVSGICFAVVIAVATAAMVANSRGAFRATVPVVAEMANVGDGLPPKSDVKFQGVRVGLVTEVTPASESGMNNVRIELDPQYARSIPSTVTARVVPSNVFAVPSVQLVHNGSAPALKAGTRISQDRSLATVRLQTSLDQLRRIIAAVGREDTDTAVGMLTLLGEATSGRGTDIENAGMHLRDIVAELNKIVSVDGVPSTLDSLSVALREVRSAAPELLDALHHSILPLRTVAEEQEKLSALMSGSLHTLGTAGTALDNQTDRIINITTHMSPPLGAFADGSSSFLQISRSMNRMNEEFGKVWNPEKQRLNVKVIVQMTPNRQYSSADCPRFGDLAGPNCGTAPVPTPVGPLPSGLHPGNFQPGPTLTPDIGPVGSPEEQQRLAEILGGDPNAIASILFGPLARGTTVSITPEENGGN